MLDLFKKKVAVCTWTCDRNTPWNTTTHVTKRLWKLYDAGFSVHVVIFSR